MKSWITWLSGTAWLVMVALAHFACSTTTQGVVLEDRSLDDGTYASPESATDSRRPTFPPHSEGP